MQILRALGCHVESLLTLHEAQSAAPETLGLFTLMQQAAKEVQNAIRSEVSHTLKEFPIKGQERTIATLVQQTGAHCRPCEICHVRSRAPIMPAAMKIGPLKRGRSGRVGGVHTGKHWQIGTQTSGSTHLLQLSRMPCSSFKPCKTLGIAPCDAALSVEGGYLLDIALLV